MIDSASCSNPLGAKLTLAVDEEAALDEAEEQLVVDEDAAATVQEADNDFNLFYPFMQHNAMLHTLFVPHTYVLFLFKYDVINKAKCS